MLLDINAIQKILPHRPPFLLVDAIEEMEQWKRIVGIKNVTMNENYFQGHFPGKPIMPGVLIIESMAQTGGLLLLKEVPDREKKLLYFVSIDNARFRRPVIPGDQLRIEMKVLAWRGGFCKLEGRASVNGELAAEATLMCKMVDLEREQAAVRRVCREGPMSAIDPRAIVSCTAKLGQNVRVGAYAVVGDEVELGEGCIVDNHAIVRGPSKFGRDNHFYSFCSIGGDAQDLTYHGERAWLEAGDGNEFREFSTANRGTDKGGNVTRIGSKNLIMAYAHIAHDCVIGDRVVLENGAQLAGHIHVEDYAVVCAFSPGAPVHAHRPAFLHWRQHRDHARRYAIFDGGRPARHALLRHQFRGPRAPRLLPGAHQSHRAGIPFPSPLQVEHRASRRKNAWNPGPLRRRLITYPVHRIGNRARLDEIEAMAAAPKTRREIGDSSPATAISLSSCSKGRAAAVSKWR